MVWTLCSYRFSAECGRLMVLCPDKMTPCSKVGFCQREEGCIRGLFALLQAPFGAAAAIEHRPDVPFWSGIAADAAQVQYWLLHSRLRQRG